MFGAIKDKFKKIQALNEDKMLEEILSEETLQGQIVDLNQKQLYEQGIQADGTPTGEYSFITVGLKLRFGDARGIPGRVDHITGLDTGETYRSMRAKSIPEGLVITANSDNSEKFFAREPKGLGLTEESLSEIRPEIKTRIIEKVREAIA